MKTIINKALKNIYKYEDYRNFLKDFFEEQKRIKKHFSHRYLAEKAGFSSPSFFHNVMNGKRNLSPKSIEMLTKGLEFQGKEERFFTFLVLWNQAKTVEEKEIYYKKMEEIRKKTSFFKVNSKQFAYFKKWYYPAVREVVVYADWEDDYTKLASILYPKISAVQAKEAVETLIDIKMIEKTESGYRQCDKLITIDNVPSYVKKDMRKHVLLKGLEAVETLSVDQRHTSFSTIALSKKGYDEVTALFDEIRKKILSDSLLENDADKIYNMVFQLYPVSRELNGAKK